jgi:hypothetical protein
MTCRAANCRRRGRRERTPTHSGSCAGPRKRAGGEETPTRDLNWMSAFRLTNLAVITVLAGHSPKEMRTVCDGALMVEGGSDRFATAFGPAYGPPTENEILVLTPRRWILAAAGLRDDVARDLARRR